LFNQNVSALHRKLREFQCYPELHTSASSIASAFVQVMGLKHAGRMWPAKAFCAARDAFREFSNNYHLRCQVPWKKCREI